MNSQWLHQNHDDLTWWWFHDDNNIMTTWQMMIWHSKNTWVFWKNDANQSQSSHKGYGTWFKFHRLSLKLSKTSISASEHRPWPQKERSITFQPSAFREWETCIWKPSANIRFSWSWNSCNVSMVVSGSPKRWDWWHSPSPNWQYIPLIVLASWGVICYLPPFRGTKNHDWMFGNWLIRWFR